ncbi:MAG TPA: glycosyltransferase family 4 protein [Oligoflexia bacterium]|nr:glycosyltransferase family 4 protein [Oligoflexia bacterium]HMP48524.1 glycosyltransferase family 4 protein [Oligoflexia bacterium]
MAKPRLLQITHAYYNRGGVEEHVKALATLLEKEIEIATLSPCRPNDENRHYQLLIKNIPLQFYPATPISWPITPLRNEESEIAVHSAIQLFRPNIIHVHHIHHWHLGLLEQLYSYKLPVIMSFHDYYVLTPHFTMEYAPELELSEEIINSEENSSSSENGPGFLTTRTYSERIFGTDISVYLKERMTYLSRQISEIDLRIVPSESAKKEFARFFSIPFEVIPHGIDLMTDISIIKPDKNFTLNNSANPPLRFGYIGSLIRQKGWHILLKAFTEARAQNRTIELHLFGGGDILFERLPDGIYYHGKYRPSDLISILSRFDIGIIPSIFKETFSYTLSELLSAKKPVIVSSIGALRDRITDKKNGILVQPDNVQELTSAILWMAENGLTHKWELTEVRTSEDMAKEYLEIYKNHLTPTE